MGARKFPLHTKNYTRLVISQCVTDFQRKKKNIVIITGSCICLPPKVCFVYSNAHGSTGSYIKTGSLSLSLLLRLLYLFPKLKKNPTRHKMKNKTEKKKQGNFRLFIFLPWTFRLLPTCVFCIFSCPCPRGACRPELSPSIKMFHHHSGRIENK